MYQSFYGLREKPFSLLPDPAYLYLSQQHEMAISLLEYSLENKAGFCVLSGQAGMGKTTLLRRLLHRMGDDVSIGLITNTHSSFGELLRWILYAFNLADGNKTRAEQYQIFIDYLIERYARHQRTLLIIDEAQNLSPAALEELRMLSNINSEKNLLLQIILVGQPRLREILRRPELEQFAQRIAVDYHLAALSLEETHGYIRHRIIVAGGESELFTDDACDAVFNLCRGIPRLINLLCDFALVYAYAEQAAVVTGELIGQVASEREIHGALPVFAGKGYRGRKNSTEKKTSVPAIAMPDAMGKELNRKTINVPPAAGPTMEKSAQVAIRGQYSPGNVASTITAKQTRPSRMAAESKTVVMAPCSSVMTTKLSVNNANVLRQVNGATLLPLIDAISETALSLVEIDKSRVKPDPPDESLEQKRNILWGTFKQDVSGVPLNVKGVAPLLSDRKDRAEAAVTQLPRDTKRLDWLAELPSRDRVPHPIRRFSPAMAVIGLLLMAGLAWSILRPSSALISRAPNISSQNSPSRAAAVAGAKSKIFEQKLDMAEPSKKSGAPSPSRKSGNHPVVSTRDRQLDITAKRMQRERDAALAMSKSAERERQALLEAANARERAQAAEHEAELAREQERVNQLAFAAEKARQEARAAKVAVLAQQKRSELETPPQSAVSANTAASQPADVSRPSQSADAETAAGENNSEPALFTANPCKGPSARFLSTCE
ncbi:MAG: AAA family ATPase [Sulfuricaulis sp.]|nr:AAA family ATPase [Sulfuricaulis sp.]